MIGWRFMFVSTVIVVTVMWGIFSVVDAVTQVREHEREIDALECAVFEECER